MNTARRLTWIGPVIAAACVQPRAAPEAEPRAGGPQTVGPPTIEVRTPQEDALLRVIRLEARPSRLELAVGERARIDVTAYDRNGRAVHGAPLVTTGAEQILIREADGTVRAARPGTDTLTVTAPAPPGTTLPPITVRIPVTIREDTQPPAPAPSAESEP